MRPETFKLPSFAKINWLLEVHGKRADGFHDLCTVFQTVSLCDQITFRSSKDLRFTANEKALEQKKNNLVLRAAQALRIRFGEELGAEIHLEKSIPFPGGLGGGSSNAAIALLGLSILWRLPLDFEELCLIGAELGSDVPFFFYGGTAIGTGRGTQITPIDEKSESCLLIITPTARVATKDAFERLSLDTLTNSESKSNLRVCRERAEKLNPRQDKLENHFEQSAFQISPEIEEVKKRLVEGGAINALLCGSGSSVFGIFDNDETRQTIMRKLATDTDWRMFAVATVTRHEYRDALKACEKLLPSLMIDGA